MNKLKINIKENRKDYLITLSIYTITMLITFAYIAQ